jgi:putative ABC transport system permease protein
MRISDDTSSLELYESINETEIRVTALSDTRQDLIAVKNDPQLQGLNGSLTLGFIVTLCITLIGYLIYWVLSIRSRLLQFGVLRAMGLSRLGLIASLVWEQLLVSGSAIIAGFGVGIIASRLFVPTLQFIYSASEQVPPFLTTASRSDYITLLSAFGVMLAAGLIILTVMIRRFKIDQILKLGED